MSAEDRERWNARYAEGAFSERTWPSALLAEWTDRLPHGKALDVACGAGRNALHLARSGWAVTAVDISGVALERGARDARAEQLDIEWVEADLELAELPVPGPFDVIVLFRYVNLPLIRALPELLAPGGWLMVEEHLHAPDAENGPSNPAFRVEPGALKDALTGQKEMRFELYSEGMVNDPDGRPFPIARAIAHF